MEVESEEGSCRSSGTKSLHFAEPGATRRTSRREQYLSIWLNALSRSVVTSRWRCGTGASVAESLPLLLGIHCRDTGDPRDDEAWDVATGHERSGGSRRLISVAWDEPSLDVLREKLTNVLLQNRALVEEWRGRLGATSRREDVPLVMLR